MMPRKAFSRKFLESWKKWINTIGIDASVCLNRVFMEMEVFSQKCLIETFLINHFWVRVDGKFCSAAAILLFFQWNCCWEKHDGWIIALWRQETLVKIHNLTNFQNRIVPLHIFFRGRCHQKHITDLFNVPTYFWMSTRTFQRKDGFSARAKYFWIVVEYFWLTGQRIKVSTCVE